MTNDKLLFSHKEAAALLGIGISTLSKLVQRGEVKVVRVGDRRLYSRRALEKFAEQTVSA
jgi:excisionase family DNA binding protein